MWEIWQIYFGRFFFLMDKSSDVCYLPPVQRALLGAEAEAHLVQAQAA